MEIKTKGEMPNETFKDEGILTNMLSRKKDFPSVYSTPTEAHKLLHGRQQSGLKEKVEKMWKDSGLTFPTDFPNLPNAAFLARAIASSRFEDLFFNDLATKAGFVPMILAREELKLSTSSPGNVSLLHQRVDTGLRNKNGEPIVRVCKIGDITAWAGKPINTIVTKQGSSLVGHHQAVRDEILPDGGKERYDLSETRKGFTDGNDYYFWYLSLFLAHGVLFEDYHGGESGSELGGFTDKVFMPALQRIEEVFGVKPLIVPLPWWKELSNIPGDPYMSKFGDVLKPELATRYAKE